jgi:glycosyltransferase involved in cell wall biosynthesis
MKILLLSAYDAPSHRRWRTALADNLPDYQWTMLTLPPRYFSWRVRGNSLTWSRDERLKNHYDLIIATSMTDLSALRGMVPSLAMIPTILYFHENQFAYPDNRMGPRSVEPAILNLYSAVCADRLVFNSEYNRTTFLQGVTDFLRKMPDQVPTGIVPELSAKSAVLPVPLEIECFTRRTEKDNLLTLLWNHRWEYDKGPARLLAICRELIDSKLEFRVNLLGQSFRDIPEEMDQLTQLLADTGRLGRCGFIKDINDYRTCLGQSHLVLSTAIHEFQGLSVLEGIAAGCCPIVPDRLSYPEFIATEYRYFSDDDGTSPAAYQQEIESAAQLILNFAEDLPEENIDLGAFSWAQQGNEYRRLFKETVIC